MNDEVKWASLPPANPSAASSLGEFLSWARGMMGRLPLDEAPCSGRIGRFEVLRELGRGTFGVVLLARDPALACERALKVPTAMAWEDDRARARFLVEARLAASIDHPNVVRVLEADDLDGLCYLVMEYCPEGSLSSWLKARGGHRPLPERWAAMLVSRIAEGVHQAHARGILHRDLKPGNILLVREGADDGSDPPRFCPKVADFGLAKLADAGADAAMSIDGTPVGTYAYMSPEQARGDRAQIAAGSDVHALGAILFELIAGRRAYPQAGREDLLGQLLGRDAPPSLRGAKPDASRELEVICRACLAKDPRDRYASAAALAEDLRRFHRGDSVRGAPLWKKARSWARAHRAAVSAGLIAATLAASGFGYKNLLDDGKAGVWLAKVRGAGLGDLPGLAGDHDPSDARVRAELEDLFRDGDPTRKLSAAVLLAGLDERCQDFAYERLLSAELRDIRPLALALEGRMPGLVGRLGRDSRAAPRSRTGDEAEADDDRRAHAAAALLLIDPEASDLDILAFSPGPQARTFAIHALGPAGVPPEILLARLRATQDDSIRRSLLQAMGEVPKSAWEARPEARRAAESEATRLYVDDPDPGVHGSAKWLLTAWDRAAKLGEIDSRLRGQVRPGFRWRINPEGLTLATIDHPKWDRIIEVSDAEVTAAQFGRLARGTAAVPRPECPASALNYLRAAEFCNALSRAEGLDACYQAGERIALEPVAGHRDRSGYRMPLGEEWEVACRAGTTSGRYFGDSGRFTTRYAWRNPESKLRLQRTAQLKPNDFGLFDTLGNVFELCQSSDPAVDPRNQSWIRGGSVMHSDPNLSASKGAPLVVNFDAAVNQSIGVRVVRTVGVRPRP